MALVGSISVQASLQGGRGSIGELAVGEPAVKSVVETAHELAAQAAKLALDARP